MCNYCLAHIVLFSEGSGDLTIEGDASNSFSWENLEDGNEKFKAILEKLND
jgi:hypothetical protein